MLTGAQVKSKLSRIEILRREIAAIKGTHDPEDGEVKPPPRLTIGLGWSENSYSSPSGKPTDIFEAPADLVDQIRQHLLEKRETELAKLVEELRTTNGVSA